MSLRESATFCNYTNGQAVWAQHPNQKEDNAEHKSGLGVLAKKKVKTMRVNLTLKQARKGQNPTGSNYPKENMIMQQME